MEHGNLLRAPRFRNALIVFSVLCAIVLLNGIFIFGGEEIYQLSTTLLSPVVALAASFLFFRVMVVVKDPKFQRLWLLLGIGFGLWGIAEVIWAVYDLAAGEMPAVTPADLLWVIGYIPLYMAFAIRQRTVHRTLTEAQKWMIGVISLVLLVVVAIIAILPILANFEPARWLEGLVNLAYPVGDLGLVVMSCVSLLLLKGGRYSLGWRLIFTGIFVMSVSDILYNYATWNEIYYPDERVDFLSSFIDTTYILSYMLAGFGAYVYSLLWAIKGLPDMRITTTPTRRYHAFVGTNQENQVISTSENFYWLVNAKPESVFYRLPLAEACGIDPRLVQVITGKIIDQGSIYREEVPIITMDKKSRTVLLSALASYDTEKAFTGINFVLGADINAPTELQMPQSRDLYAITRNILSESSTQLKEGDQALRTYFLETLRMLFSVLSQFGGEQHRDEIVSELNHNIQQKNLDAEIRDQVITISEDYEGEELSGILSELLQQAQSLVSKFVGEQAVQEKMEEFEQQMMRALPSSLDRNRLKMPATQSG
jgi:hypothetical protein